MAYSAAYTVAVNAPASKLFDYVADVSRHGEWGTVQKNYNGAMSNLKTKMDGRG